MRLFFYFMSAADQKVLHVGEYVVYSTLPDQAARLWADKRSQLRIGHEYEAELSESFL